ncbi:MAG: hypothetical protein GFH27_549323n61 [Chloroflexi bacterium AL-W]|nr:hypothetical protein [Chloroflexi bacterium AL-N1]NOK70212.1 hypothetical protein [Chloroflexi bacterium AL-N10]NOK77749.1 hypothetical protein [Chloroflexi bacterium AL-N5]NOK84758.1 hypothetical protein [Chloroflexi bacterium AL-W]NOK93179.1 hypothetical protein [Chloroflexi bacterium AL-N15]
MYNQLLELATDVQLLHQAEPACYAPLHALRLLGEMPQPTMMEQLLQVLPINIDDPDKEVIQLWTHELPQIMARMGDTVVDQLWTIVDNTEHELTGRGIVLIALAYITVLVPDRRSDVITQIHERLPTSENKTFTGYMVSTLSNLGAEQTYSDVMKLFREGRVDQAIIPPGVARQLLLSDSTRRLADVRLSFWERYDELGPFGTTKEDKQLV